MSMRHWMCLHMSCEIDVIICEYICDRRIISDGAKNSATTVIDSRKYDTRENQLHAGSPI